MHLTIPIEPELDWSALKPFCRALADAMARYAPDQYVATASKSLRHGKIFVDYLRNTRGATFIAPYSTRARPGAPVAMPVSWQELPQVRSDSFTVANIAERLRRMRRNPWADFEERRRRLPAKLAKQGPEDFLKVW